MEIKSSDFNWNVVEVPLKRCEFIRARKKFLSLSVEEANSLIATLLSSLPPDDQKFVLSNVIPTFNEIVFGSDDEKTHFLWSLIKIIMYRYRSYKKIFYEAVKNSDIDTANEAVTGIFCHYEAMRILKKSLIGGKELLFRDMPSFQKH